MGFRPLAGITVFRTYDIEHFTVRWVSGFRPLAGITVFRTIWSGDPKPSRMVEFPSPGGDYGLSDFRAITLTVASTESFRPLAGITVFRTWSS